MREPTPDASRADGEHIRVVCAPICLVGAVAAAALVSLVFPSSARAGPQEPQFVDINPDDSGPKPGCAAPCASGGSGGRVHRLSSSRGRPNEIYAASELGGLFRGTFQANPEDIVWSHLDAFLPTKAWDVAIDPDGERIYATSFYDGRVNSLAGIQVSGDRGQTWTRPLTATPPALFCDQLRLDQPSGFGISIRPGSAKEVLVGTNCGLARSVDFGITWEFINPSSAGGPALSVWAVAALRGGRTYACGENGVMRSPDGRTGWVTLPDPSGTPTPYRYCSIAADSDFPDAVFVVFSLTTFFDPIFDIRNSTYFASFDGGNTWTAMPHPDPGGLQKHKRVPMVTTNRRSYGLDVWVGAGNLFRIPCTPILCPVTDQSLWRGTFTDGNGDRQKAHGDTGNVLFASARSIDACPLFYSSDGGVYFNQNHNSRVADCHDPVFLSANVGLHAQLPLGMAGSHRPGSQGEDIYMALQDDGLFATRHAGAPNRMWSHGGTADVFDVVADDTQAIVIDQAGIRWGEPGFTNPLNVPNTPLPAAALRFFGVFTDDIDQFAPSSYVLAAAVKIPRQFDPIPDVLFTTNLTEANVKSGTVTWTSLNWPSALAGIPCGVKAGRFARAVRGVAVVRVYVMSGDCLWRGANQLWTTILGSNTWTRISSACPNGGFGIFGVDRARPNRVYASCTGGTDDPRMLRSNDSGDTWQVDQNLTDLMTGPGIFVPRFRNPEDGATFGGVQPVMVAFDPHDDNILVAGGYESGVFISSDGGKGWSLLTDPFTPASSKVPHLPRPFFAHFDHEAGGPLRALYIGSVGRGVWRIELAETDVHLSEKIRQAACLAPCLPRPCLTCEVIKGQELELEFQVINAGSGVAGNPVFRLSLPEGLTFRSLAAPRSWQCQTPRVGAFGEVRCALTSLGAGSHTTMTVRARVDASAGATLRTEASIVSNALDRNPENNRVTAANPVSVPTER